MSLVSKPRAAEVWAHVAGLETKERLMKMKLPLLQKAQDGRDHGKKLGLAAKSTKGAQEKLLVKVLSRLQRGPQDFGDVSTIGSPPGTAAVEEFSLVFHPSGRTPKTTD